MPLSTTSDTRHIRLTSWNMNNLHFVVGSRCGPE